MSMLNPSQSVPLFYAHPLILAHIICLEFVTSNLHLTVSIEIEFNLPRSVTRIRMLSLHFDFFSSFHSIMYLWVLALCIIGLMWVRYMFLNLINLGFLLYTIYVWMRAIIIMESHSTFNIRFYLSDVEWIQLLIKMQSYHLIFRMVEWLANFIQYFFYYPFSSCWLWVMVIIIIIICNDLIHYKILLVVSKNVFEL